MESNFNYITFKGKKASQSGTTIFNTCAAMGMLPKRYTRSTVTMQDGQKSVSDTMFMQGRDADGKLALSMTFDIMKNIEFEPTLTSIAENLNDCLSMADLTKEDKLKLSIAIGQMQEGEYTEANNAALEVLKNNKYHMSTVVDLMDKKGFKCADFAGTTKSDIGMRAM